ncbi:hypothetical protein Ocin01_14180 [Orchesella cincta]|uniref:Glycoamylase-like domain-containing protein n=1 Tax=Orchesella cincta TaxID=48709 RepID=A0A1D2MHP6_ORCCI|nr:hypothetical protein Ocin01_14180 [Orchesella cincta]
MRQLPLAILFVVGIVCCKLAESRTDEELLDEVERASIKFFWEQADPITGQVKDRGLASGENDPRDIASVAATGFGLTALAIAHEREYMDRAAIEARVQGTLEYIYYNLTHVNGFYYHFINMTTGERVWNSELSSIDTALMMGGVLTVGQYFKNNSVIGNLSQEIYQRVDYEWMLNGTDVLNMGWNPETGFLNDWWNRYCELMILVIQAIGSPTHPIPVTSWNAFSRPNFTYAGINYIHFPTPIFVHQYAHAWIDFRNQVDNFTIDYFENSVKATRATKLFFTQEMSTNFTNYGDNFWGLTASDTPYGYDAWGGPPLQGKIDGSIVPCAAGGSVPFLPNDTLAVLHNLRDNYADQAWTHYGFVDAFNPVTGWTDPDVIGIDVGITVLMAENYRTEFVWKHYMQDPHVRRAMDAIGFVNKDQ